MFPVQRKRWHSAALFAVFLMTSGCHSPYSQSPADLLARFPTPIYSLTGEVLNGGTLRHLGCEEAQQTWITRVGRNHDGTMDLDDLLAEAKSQFAAMDLNHDGFITAYELSQYRLRNDPDSAQPKPDDSQHSHSDEQRDRNGIHRMAQHPNGSQPDPVLAADNNLDFKVTLDEFLELQRENFRHYDKNRIHKLDANDLNQLCRDREKSATTISR